MKFSISSFRSLSSIHHSIYLWIATLIFAASSSVTRQITELGSQNLVDGRNPISLCNVLFVGNLCALMVMVPLFRHDLTRHNFHQLTRKNWISLSAIALLSGAIAPALIFTALDQTTVTSVVLISRLEPILGLILSIIFLRARINSWTFTGTVFSFAGVAIAALLRNSTQTSSGLLHIHKGELFVAFAAIILAIAEVISKLQLQAIPLGLFSTFRTAVGTVIFFSVAVVLYGGHHFVDAFSPFLWKWMILYGTVIVVIGQLCWFQGLKHATVAEITLASSFNPLAAILIASLILQESPTTAQYLGGSIILLGVVLNAIGKLHHAKSENPVDDKLDPTKFMEMEMGFKGI